MGEFDSNGRSCKSCDPNGEEGLELDVSKSAGKFGVFPGDEKVSNGPYQT